MKRNILIVLAAALFNISQGGTNQIARIASHVRYTYDANKPAKVYVPFFANYAAELTYQIQVYNSQGIRTFQDDGFYHKFFPNSYYLVDKTIDPAHFSVGQNMFVINYRFDNKPPKIIYSYFHAIDVKNVDINSNGNNGYFSNIVEYSFFEESQTAVINRVNFNTSKFYDYLYFSSDLFFDFNVLKSKFTYFKQQIPYSSAYLLFDDTSIFPKMPIFNNKTHIQLELVYQNYTLSFTTKNNLYVDPISQMISTNPEPGYLPTKSLYFPRGKFDHLNHASAQIIINDFIMSGLNVIYTFQLDLGEPYIGNNGYYQIGISRY